MQERGSTPAPPRALPEGVTQLNSILLQDGREVRLPEEFEKLVSSFVTQGCTVRIEAEPGCEDFPETHFHATLITNLDTEQTAALPAPKHRGKQG